MTASLETLVIAAYIFADGVAIPRPGPSGKTTDAVSEALPSGLERTEVDRESGDQRRDPVSSRQALRGQRRVELPLSPTDAVPLGLAVASEEHLLHRIAKRRRHAPDQVGYTRS